MLLLFLRFFFDYDFLLLMFLLFLLLPFLLAGIFELARAGNIAQRCRGLCWCCVYLLCFTLFCFVSLLHLFTPGVIICIYFTCIYLFILSSYTLCVGCTTQLIGLFLLLFLRGFFVFFSFFLFLFLLLLRIVAFVFAFAFCKQTLFVLCRFFLRKCYAGAVW